MKRTIFAALLIVHAAVGAPRPEGLEAECGRLETAIREYAPGCGQRMEGLRVQAEGLAPGPARAAYYWVAGVWAGKHEQEEAQKRFQRLAVQEPGLEAARKARWLMAMDQDDPWPLLQITRLYEQAPEDRVLYCMQQMQAESAESKGQKALGRSLRLAALRLAEKEGWLSEQLDCWLILQGRRDRVAENQKERDRCWEGALKVARRSGRTEHLWRVLGCCTDQQQWKRALSAFAKPPDALERDRRFAEVFAPYESDNQFILGPEKGVELWSDLVSRYHARRDFENEIQAREGLSKNLRRAGRVRDSIRQLEAALQLRLDHPLVDGWGRLDAYQLSGRLVWLQSMRGYPLQALDTSERALQAGWATSPRQNWNLHASAMSSAKTLGDLERLESHWKANFERLAEQPEMDLWGDYSDLHRNLPPSQEPTRFYARWRQWAEGVLKRADAPPYLHLYGVSSLGFALRAQGEVDSEIRLWRSELANSLNRGDRQGIEWSVGLLAHLYRETGRVQEMRELIKERQADPGFSKKELRQLALDGCALLKGDPESLNLAEQYLLSCQQSAPQSSAQLEALVNKTTVLLEVKRLEAAGRCLEEAQQLHDKLPSDRRRSSLATLRSRWLWESGRQTEALTVLQTAVEQTLAQEAPAPVWLVKELAARHREIGQDWQSDYRKVAERLEKSGETVREQLSGVTFQWLQQLAAEEQWESGRQVLARFPWRASVLEEQTRKLQEHAAWRDLLPARPGQPPANGTSLAAVVDELRLQNPELGQLVSLRSTNLRHLEAQLGAHDSLVTYCQVGSQLYLLVLRSQGSFYKAVPISDLSATLRAYLSNLHSERPQPAERELYSLLLEPVLQDLPEQRIYLVPNGNLWQVPFGALRDPQGRAAASRAELVMLSSGDLLRMADRSWQPYQLSQPLAIGAPTGADLPGAFAELAEVARVLPDCQLSRGAQATSQELYRADRRWGLLHFASHAHYRVDRPTESDIELEDGPLQLKQLSQLSLAEHSLVALSCCQGGASAGQPLDEPVTLATGFSAAGAETVVAHLWRVDDEVARIFFAEFYQKLAAGGSPGQSFRQAQQHCRQLYPNPRDWAGFFLMGNPT
jgi:tetratricopeptide (TPR) repeat protein